MPLEGAMALVLAVILFTLTVTLPWFLKIVTGTLLAISLFAAFFAFLYRAQIPFLWVIYLGRYVEPGRVPSECKTRL